MLYDKKVSRIPNLSCLGRNLKRDYLHFLRIYSYTEMKILICNKVAFYIIFLFINYHLSLYKGEKNVFLENFSKEVFNF